MNTIEKVQSMSAKEIIMAMVEGLKNPTTKIDMLSFGNVDNNVCYGCAATNTICNIMNITHKDFIKANPKFTMCDLFDERNFVINFERAIDCLRNGMITTYNYFAKENNFATIIGQNHSVPKLTNVYTNDDLEKYIDLANKQ